MAEEKKTEKKTEPKKKAKVSEIDDIKDQLQEIADKLSGMENVANLLIGKAIVSIIDAKNQLDESQIF